MIAFDTDVLSELFAGNASYAQRLEQIAEAERGIPIVVAVEVARGWLAAVRQAEANKGRMTLEYALGRFQQSLVNMMPFTLLPYDSTAHTLVQAWQKSKIRVGTSDMRIAAICIVNGATLVTRNARDYTQLTGLTLDVWN